MVNQINYEAEAEKRKKDLNSVAGGASFGSLFGFLSCLAGLAGVPYGIGVVVTGGSSGGIIGSMFLNRSVTPRTVSLGAISGVVVSSLIYLGSSVGVNLTQPKHITPVQVNETQALVVEQESGKRKYFLQDESGRYISIDEARDKGLDAVTGKTTAEYDSLKSTIESKIGEKKNGS